MKQAILGNENVWNYRDERINVRNHFAILMTGKGIAEWRWYYSHDDLIKCVNDVLECEASNIAASLQVSYEVLEDIPDAFEAIRHLRNGIYFRTTAVEGTNGEE